MTEQKVNPVTQALHQVSEDWEDFAADSKARIARWYVNPDGARIVNMMLEMVEQDVLEKPDLFIRIGGTLATANDYHWQVAQQLRMYAEELNKQLEAEDEPVVFDMLPAISTTAKAYSAKELATALTQFRRVNAQIVGLLVLVITPHELPQPEQWPLWINQFLTAESALTQSPTAPPSKVRLMCFDPPDLNYLAELAEQQPDAVTTLQCDFNVADAAKDIVDEIDDDDPGAIFRQHFVNLSNAAEKQDLPLVEKHGETAIALAKQHHWFDMEVVVGLAIANAYLSQSDYNTSLERYEQTLVRCEQGQQDQAELANTMTYQTLMGKAMVEFCLERYAEAAISYSQAADIAEGDDEYLNALEAWRMASFSYEKAGATEPAWQTGWQALAAGEQLDKPMRSEVTLPYVGEALLRLAPDSRSFAPKHTTEDVQQRLTAAVGDDWQDKAA